LIPERDEVYDLIVVGAGPAGSTAARTASMMGLNVLMLEKEVFPRYKPCAGALSDKTISLLDFPIPEELCERTINKARFHFQGKVVESRKDHRLIALVTRSNFDHLLLNKAEGAGAKLKIEKVIGFRERDECVEVQTGSHRFSSRFLVVASGCQDGLKNNIQCREARNHYCICMVTEVEAAEQEINDKFNNIINVHFGVASGGYGWIFPHRGYYSVGIGGMASLMKYPRQIMLDFLKANGFNGSYRLHGHTLPLGGLNRHIATKRIMLAGDAAGFVDAFTGEGIYYAMRSGEIAAKTAAEKLSNPDMDIVQAYKSRCKRDFGDELRYSLLLSRAMHNYPGIFFRIFTSQDKILDKCIETLTARTTYKNFICWLAPRLPLCVLRSLWAYSSYESKSL
jgi:geranylgeranyl reductase family protein